MEAEQDFFFDFPSLGHTVEASVDAADDLAIDNHAYLVRQRTYPKLEPRSEISPELQRMIDVTGNSEHSNERLVLSWNQLSSRRNYNMAAHEFSAENCIETYLTRAGIQIFSRHLLPFTDTL